MAGDERQKKKNSRYFSKNKKNGRCNNCLSRRCMNKHQCGMYQFCVLHVYTCYTIFLNYNVVFFYARSFTLIQFKIFI